MTDDLRTDKQKVIAQAIHDDPSGSDSTIARRSGASRNLVRRVRERIDPSPPAETAPAAAPDAVFGPGGVADRVAEPIGELVLWIGRFDRLLAQLEVTERGRFLAFERRRLIQELSALAEKLQTELVPAGLCPFCTQGCARCAGGRWVPSTLVDAFATIEERQKKSRWLRRNFLEFLG